jgi:hypothetical protein
MMVIPLKNKSADRITVSLLPRVHPELRLFEQKIRIWQNGITGENARTHRSLQKWKI